MNRAGYDRRGMVEFLQVLRAQQGRDPGSVQTFFSSHPAPGERIRRLQQEANRLAGGRRNSQTFQAIQRGSIDSALPPRCEGGRCGRPGEV